MFAYRIVSRDGTELDRVMSSAVLISMQSARETARGQKKWLLIHIYFEYIPPKCLDLCTCMYVLPLLHNYVFSRMVPSLVVFVFVVVVVWLLLLLIDIHIITIIIKVVLCSGCCCM